MDGMKQLRTFNKNIFGTFMCVEMCNSPRQQAIIIYQTPYITMYLHNP